MSRSHPLAFFSDYLCPYAYFASGELASLAEAKVQTRRIAALLLPNLTEEGLTIEAYDEIRGNTPEIRARNNAMLAAEAAQAGLPWIDRKALFCSRPAHVFAKWALAEGAPEERVHREIYLAEYERGENIGATPVLEEVARRLDLRPDRVKAALANEGYRRAADADYEVQKAFVFLQQYVRAEGAGSAMEEQTLLDWLSPRSELPSWARLRTLTLPDRHSEQALIGAARLMETWEPELSDWPRRLPSAYRFHEFVRGAQSVLDHKLAA